MVKGRTALRGGVKRRRKRTATRATISNQSVARLSQPREASIGGATCRVLATKALKEGVTMELPVIA